MWEKLNLAPPYSKFWNTKRKGPSACNRENECNTLNHVLDSHYRPTTLTTENKGMWWLTEILQRANH